VSVDPPSFETTDDPDPEAVRVVDEGLGDFNDAVIGDAVGRFACFARDRDGRVVGGALARTWGACCELQILWVEESRRRAGVGRELVRRVEQRARSMDCTLLYLETFSFQAPRFYAELGFETASELRGFPDGISKLLMRKGLA